MSSKPGSHIQGSSIAFDMGANAVRVVEIEWTGAEGAGRLLKRGSAPLPVNAWNDLPGNAPAFAAALRQALSSAGITAKSVAASLPRRLVTLRFARLPHAPPEQMQGLVAFEAQQYVLFPLDEVILDYHVVTNSAGVGIPSEDDMESVLLAAARRTLITDLIAIFERAGLELELLTVSALALAELIRDAIEPTAVIDVEPGEMDVAVVANRQLLFTRASGLDVSGAQPDIAARRLADEVARSFTSFQNEYRHQTLLHVNLTGSSVQGQEGMAVEQTLSSVLEMHIGRLSHRLIPAGDAEASAYATAIGAAIQMRPGSMASINLVPDERAIKKAQQVHRRRQQAGVVTAVAAALLIGFFVQRAVAANAKDKAARQYANEELRKYTNIVDAKRKQFDKKKALYDELNAGMDRNHPAIDVLVALNRALPQTADIWLTQFAFDRSGLITIHGDTKSAPAATAMVIALQDSGAFTDVKLAYLGDAQETNVVASAAPSGPPAAASAPVDTTPVTPLPAMPPAAAPARPSVPIRATVSGGPRTTPTIVTFQPGQGFPGGPPPGVIRPATGGSPASRNPAPPPFYLIGYGQAASPPAVSPGAAAIPRRAVKGAVQTGPAASAVTRVGSTSSNRTVASALVARPAGRGISPVINAAPGPLRPSAPAAGDVPRPKGTLTSFIITCRINPDARTLIIKGSSTAVAGGKETRIAPTGAPRRPIGDDTATTDLTDTGGEPDAAPQ